MGLYWALRGYIRLHRVILGGLYGLYGLYGVE